MGGRRTWLDRAAVEALKTAPAPGGTLLAILGGARQPRRTLAARPPALAPCRLPDSGAVKRQFPDSSHYRGSGPDNTQGENHESEKHQRRQ
jgi:hypothetical protein